MEQTISQHRQKLEPCLVEARRRNPALGQVRLEFVVTGQGRVLASRIDGRRFSPLARCINQQMRTIRFPPFNLNRTIAAVTLAAPQ